MFDALYDGYRAAKRPAITAPTRMATMIVGLKASLLITSFGHRHRQHYAEERSDDDADDRTERRHDHRFPPHRSTRLALVHPDGAEQADLPRSFEHPERERDRDPEDGDHDREGEQCRDDEQQLVDLRLLRVEELGVALDVGLRDTAPSLPAMAASPTAGSTPSASLAMMNRSRAGASLTPASVSRLMSQFAERCVSEDAGNRQRLRRLRSGTSRPRSSRRSRRDRSPDPCATATRSCRVRRRSPSIRSGSTSLSNATGSTAPIALVVAVDLSTDVADRGDRIELGDRGERFTHHGREPLEAFVGDDVVGGDGALEGVDQARTQRRREHRGAAHECDADHQRRRARRRPPRRPCDVLAGECTRAP